MGDVELCGAKTRRGGAACRNAAGWKTSHPGVGRCVYHGGASPNGILAAAREEARREVERVVVMGVPAPTDPGEALQLCIATSTAELLYCTRKIAQLEEDDAVGPVVTEVSRRGDSDEGSYEQTTKGPPAVHVWIRVRAEAQERAARFAKMALDANVAERQTQVLEQHADVIAEVFVRVFDDMGVTPDQRRLGAAAVERHLELVDSTATEVVR